MRRNINNKRKLYESIMRDVAKTVKKHLNENYNSQITSKSEFIRISNKVYQNWLDKTCNDVLYDLEINGIIPAVEDIDDFDDEFDNIWDEIEPIFFKKLSDAVGGDWYQVGNSVGLSDEQLENIYVDKYQAKTDPVVDYYNK